MRWLSILVLLINLTVFGQNFKLSWPSNKLDVAISESQNLIDWIAIPYLGTSNAIVVPSKPYNFFKGTSTKLASSVGLAWDKVPDADYVILGYTVAYSPYPGLYHYTLVTNGGVPYVNTDYYEVSVGPEADSMIINGLQTSTTYYFAIRARYNYPNVYTNENTTPYTDPISWTSPSTNSTVPLSLSLAITSEPITVKPINNKPGIFARYTVSGTSPLTINATNIPANALLVLSAANEGDSTKGADLFITSNPSLTWVKRADAQASQSGNAEIWSTTYIGGNLKITNNYNTNMLSSAVLYVVTNAVVGQAVVANSQSSPSVSLTPVSTNSMVVAVTSDWNGVSGTPVYRRSVSAVLDYLVSGKVRNYHYTDTLGQLILYTEGLTSPSTQKAGTSLIEIKP